MNKKIKEKLVMEKLLEKVDNRFVLSIVSSRRGRQLLAGANPLVEVDKDEKGLPILIALREMMNDKILVKVEQ